MLSLLNLLVNVSFISPFSLEDENSQEEYVGFIKRNGLGEQTKKLIILFLNVFFSGFLDKHRPRMGKRRYQGIECLNKIPNVCFVNFSALRKDTTKILYLNKKRPMNAEMIANKFCKKSIFFLKLGYNFLIFQIYSILLN